MELILILGGAKSGKSAYAEKLAQERGGDAVLYVATAEPGDEEMRVRIARHRVSRPHGWQTLEVPRALERALEDYQGTARVVVLDCLTLLVSNLMLAGEADAPSLLEDELDAIDAWRHARGVDLIVVSNEVGMGIVPDNELARIYRDLLGAVNQRVARAADHVIMMVAGVPLAVK